jgi:hypothetical protein
LRFVIVTNEAYRLVAAFWCLIVFLFSGMGRVKGCGGCVVSGSRKI